jgi:hypothetical protein
LRRSLMTAYFLSALLVCCAHTEQRQQQSQSAKHADAPRADASPAPRCGTWLHCSTPCTPPPPAGPCPRARAGRPFAACLRSDYHRRTHRGAAPDEFLGLLLQPSLDDVAAADEAPAHVVQHRIADLSSPPPVSLRRAQSARAAPMPPLCGSGGPG